MRKPHLRHPQIVRLGRLLNMLYRPAELAEEIHITPDTVYRSYLAAGLPHSRDAHGSIWIHGPAFVAWATPLIATRRAGIQPASPVPVTRVTGEKTIHRQNWLDVRLYLRHLAEERQHAPETVHRARAHLRHLLEWAGPAPLPTANRITPAFPIYLVNRRLSPSSIKKGLEAARHFFAFARDHWPARYRRIPASWIDLLLPPRGSRLESHLVVHRFYTLDDVRRLLGPLGRDSLGHDISCSLRVERAQAAAAMLFLSGMRSDAFASLPISCVDLPGREIRQLPEMGVRTKNRKAAHTYLLDIPDLFDVVLRWDRRLRDLPLAALWYSPLTRDGMTLVPTTVAHLGRGHIVDRDLRLICARSGVPYLSPHKLRHGHVVHALKQAHNMAELKAISQNVMHASVTITDQIYGDLVNNDVRTIIGGLGHKSQLPDSKLAEILDILKAV